jgi:diguanylate cyclase (GGDEF)-like protein
VIEAPASAAELHHFTQAVAPIVSTPISTGERGKHRPHRRPSSIGTIQEDSPGTRYQPNGEIVLWQSKLRLAFVLIAGTVLGEMYLAKLLDGPVGAVGVIAGLYLVAIGAVCVVVRRTREARDWHIIAAVTADILLIFGTTFLLVPPQYYARTLLFSFVILHMTEFYYGRALAYIALGTISLAYLEMVRNAIVQGAALSWPQELLSLGAFAAAGASFVFHYGNFKERLQKIVLLFERAEEGDFSRTYDVEADMRPDGITMVGRAYNRVASQLAALVLTDPLSGCHNRRGFDQQLEREIARATRHGTHIALIALDVDAFKSINDNHGHLAGDAVIREVGALLRDLVRTSDVVARTGGDEFMLLLPETEQEGAFRLASRIREAVATRDFQGVRGKRRITVSIGVVSDLAVDENIAQDLRSRADEALYAAKDAGRDRVCLWTPELRAIAVTAAHHRVTTPLQHGRYIPGPGTGDQGPAETPGRKREGKAKAS